jgi:hypothetical protein
MTTFTEDRGASRTTRVWIASTSAGGFASVLDWDRVQRAFGVRTDIIARA